MKYAVTAQADRDFRRLPVEHQRAFRASLPAFIAAAEKAAVGVDNPWPPGLRIKAVTGTPGVWEMTWSKDHPGGRATWEWTHIAEEPAIRWRRIGNHSIFTAP